MIDRIIRWTPWLVLLLLGMFSCRVLHGQVNPLTSQNIYVKGALTKTETQTNTGFGIILNATGGTGGGGGSSYGANAPLSLSGTNFGLVTATSAGFALTNGSLTIVSATLATNIGLGTAAYTASGTFAPAFGTTGGITLNGTNLTTIVGPGLINTAGTLAIDPQYATYQSSLGNWYFGRSGNTTGTGLQNFGMGSNALQAVTNGSGNAAYGYNALQAANSGSDNVGIGNGALLNLTGGSWNTAIGFNCLISAVGSQASNNTAIGYAAMAANTTGSNDTALGIGALNSNTSGIDNTACGYQALATDTVGFQNTAMGYNCCYSMSTGNFNVASGINALYYSTTGSENTAIGYVALQNALSNYNTGVGGTNLFSLTTGGSNSAVGYLAGYNAGTPLQTITKCTFLGTAANASADALTNSMALGYNAQVTASNQAVIGNTSVTTATIGAASAAGVNLTGTGGYTFGNGAAAANQSPVMNYVYTAAVSGGTATVDLAQGNIETVALTSSVTTINVINTPAAGKRMTIVFYQPSGGVQPAVWSGTTILWSNGTTGTFTAATGKHDIMSVLYDGTNCYAIMSSNY